MVLEEIEDLLRLHPDLEEVFEILDITPLEVIEILIRQGYVEIPDYVRRYETEESEEETDEA